MEDIDYHSFPRVNYEEVGDRIRAKYCLVHTLLDITRILSPSTFEHEISAYCARTLSENGFRVEVDTNGNILARRGYGNELPLLNAHMDTVLAYTPHTTEDRPEVKAIINEVNINRKELYKKADKLRNELKKADSDRRWEIKKELKELNDIYNLDAARADRAFHEPRIITLDRTLWKPEEINYYSKHDIIASSGVNVIASDEALGNDTGYDQQIGGDDKAGVGIILCLAKMTDIDFKVLLTVGEEPPFMGINGIRSIPSSFYNDVLYCMTLDKQNKDILVTKISDTQLCSSTFAKAIMHYANFCGVKLHTEIGAGADAYFIAKYCETVNMSVGYYNPHSKKDFIRVDETLNSMCIVETCLNNLGLLFQYSQRPVH